MEEVIYFKVLSEKEVLVVYKNGGGKVIKGKITKKKLKSNQKQLL